MRNYKMVKIFTTLLLCGAMTITGVATGCRGIKHFKSTPITSFFGEKKSQAYKSTQGYQIFSSQQEALDALNSLTVAEADNSEYSAKVRKSYGGWQIYKNTNTRIEVLKLQANDYKLNNNGRVISGTWNIAYTGKTLSFDSKEDVAKNLQIDHIIPVAYAHRHGAASWDQDKKEEFYNDFGEDVPESRGENKTIDYPKVGNLIVSDAASNIAKSDAGPSKWMPANPDYVLTYCEKWAKIAQTYGISLSQADVDTIKAVFDVNN